MMFTAIRRLLAIILLSGIFLFGHAQPDNDPVKNEPKPYQIFTSGKLVTVKSTRDIQSVMVWTSSGHRIVEQKDINSTSYSFRININEKIFFVMLELKGEKRYTEKIGIE